RCGAAGDDHGDAGASLDGLAEKAHVTRPLCEDFLGRRAHADLFAIDDGISDVRVLAEVIEPDPAKLAAGQSLFELLEALAAVGRFVNAGRLAPFEAGVVAVVTFGDAGAVVGIESVAPALP